MDSECRVYYVEHKDRIVLQEVLILGGEIRLEKVKNLLERDELDMKLQVARHNLVDMKRKID